jgi:hypothetical protein
MRPGHPAILGLRLKIENRKIGEMETIIIRSTSRGSFSSPQDLRDQPLLNETLAPGERNTRDELVTVANSYFEGLEKATDKYTPFDKNCKRIENGQVTSNEIQQIAALVLNVPYGMPTGWGKKE